MNTGPVGTELETGLASFDIITSLRASLPGSGYVWGGVRRNGAVWTWPFLP